MAVSMGAVIALIKALGGADPSVIASAVDAWLDDHPEATTTVEDGSITYDKLASALAAAVDSIADKYEKPGTGIPGTDLASGVIPDISGKQDAPETPGTAGQVLGLDANLAPVWTNKGGGSGGAVDDVQVNGVSVVTDGVAEITIDPVETVTGATPSISAVPGVRYICGECSTLTIVVPSSGIIDVTFESGSTPTVLTVTPPTGVTAIKWANGFDPSSLEANTTYEINIMDGEFGVVGSWT